MGVCIDEQRVFNRENSLKEALEAQLGIERVLFQRDMERKRISELIDLLEERGIPFDWADKQRLNAVSPKHQGVIAYLSAFPYADLTDLIEQNRFLIMCDGITDPHNLGAIIRSAYSFGAGGIIIPKRRSAGWMQSYFEQVPERRRIFLCQSPQSFRGDTNSQR